MDPFCNTCFRVFGELDCDLFCTQCYHVVCKTCILSNSERCTVCNQNCRLMKVSKDMPENMLKFFKDPLLDLDNSRKIIKFQEEQRSFYSRHAKLVFEEHQRLRESIVRRKMEYDALRKKVAEAERQVKESGQSGYSGTQTLRTPQSSHSGTSSSQFSANASAIERKTEMSDSSFWKDTPSSGTSGTFRYGMSRLTIRDGMKK